MAMPDFNHEVQKFLQDTLASEAARTRATEEARARATRAKRIGQAKTAGMAAAVSGATSLAGAGVSVVLPSASLATGVGVHVAHVAVG